MRRVPYAVRKAFQGHTFDFSHIFCYFGNAFGRIRKSAVLRRGRLIRTVRLCHKPVRGQNLNYPFRLFTARPGTRPAERKIQPRFFQFRSKLYGVRIAVKHSPRSKGRRVIFQYFKHIFGSVASMYLYGHLKIYCKGAGERWLLGP